MIAKVANPTANKDVAGVEKVHQARQDITDHFSALTDDIKSGLVSFTTGCIHIFRTQDTAAGFLELCQDGAASISGSFDRFRRDGGSGSHGFQAAFVATGTQRTFLIDTSSSGDASLHAKVAVFDRKVTWVGSFNLDPRSAELNTELAIVIHSEDLGGRAAALIERDLEPDRAWRLALESRGTGGLEMVWYGRRGSGIVRETSEPDATVAQRAIVNVMKFIPGVEGLL